MTTLPKLYGWLLIVLIALAMAGVARGDIFLTTAYDNCRLCTGKSPGHPAYGITASGKKARDGYVAVNWLPFGSKLVIDGKVYTVHDRGAKSLFGDKKNHIKHLDIWMNDHRAALRYGRQYKQVEIMRAKQ